MKLDREFSREISKVANGDGSREAKFSFKATVQEVKKALSNTHAPKLFNACVKEYGRVPVAICTAQTIINRRDRLSGYMYQWAVEVMKLWTNRTNDLGYAIIDDGLHPTRIEEYAGAFVRLTTDEGGI